MTGIFFTLRARLARWVNGQSPRDLPSGEAYIIIIVSMNTANKGPQLGAAVATVQGISIIML